MFEIAQTGTQSNEGVENVASTDVLVVGAGPTGLTLAAALVARHVRVTVVERLATLGIHARRFTIRDRDRVLIPIDFDRLPTRYPYTLMVSQAETERVLLQRLVELGGEVIRPHTVVDLEQDARGVIAMLDDGTTVRARYLVGADGMHSFVRKWSGISFAGGSYEESFVLADVRLDSHLPADEVILYFSSAGLVVVAPLPEGVHRIVAAVDDAPEQPSAAYVQSLLDARGPLHERAVVREIVWGSRFRLHHRVADVYRAGRVLLAGDAAHVHSPAGGQGMNAGILDALNLADALTAALTQGQDAALDAYGVRRRPVAQQIVRLADRLTRLATVPPILRPLRNLLLKIIAHVPALRRRLAWQLSGLIY